MFSLHLAQKKQKQINLKKYQDEKGKKWLKKYHSQIKPKLLERYDARVNAFIRQIEQAPLDKGKLLSHYQSSNFRPLKFNNPTSHRHHTEHQQKLNISMKEMTQSIRRSSKYIPLSDYQYRERQKQKEIKPQIQLKILKYRKWQKESHQFGSLNIKNKQDQKSVRQFFRRAPQDNRSQLQSMHDDNMSLRFSVNENIQGQARQYEKNQQLMQKKQHFKRLANLEQAVKDQRAKKSIHQLLVKGGFTRPKIKVEHQELEVDFLKLQMDKHIHI